MRQWIRHSCMALIWACLVGAIANTRADNALPVAPLPPDVCVDGIDQPELTARWWRWVLHAPIAPYLDPDGRICDYGQEGPVWFLAGTEGSGVVRRRCVVPSGKYLLFPVINMVYMQVQPTREHPTRMSCAKLQARASANNDNLVSAVVLVDGVAVQDVRRYRVQTPHCFPLTVDARGEATDGALLAASDGYWLLLPPLPAGHHVIVVGANYGSKDRPYGNMIQDFQYDLDVGGVTILSGVPKGAGCPSMPGCARVPRS